MKTIIDFANKVRSLADGRISNIANVEESPSTHPYAVGKQLIFNGLLCRATSAIAVGDTLAVGTNLALSDNVVEQIYSLNQGLTNSLANILHENLLDNPWFTVNQRGQSSYSYSGGSYNYTVDRWYNNYPDGVVTVGNGVTLNNYKWFCQPLDADIVDLLDGKTVTASVMLSDGTIISGTEVFHADNAVTYVQIKSGENAFIRTSNQHNMLVFEVVNFAPSQGEDLTIRAVKLELGSISTLAMDTAPNYAEELQKCQRYFWRKKASVAPYIGLINATGSCCTTISTPTIMRVVPTMSAITASADLGQCAIYGVGRSTTPSAISIMNNSPIGNGVVVLASTFSDANLTPNNAVSQRFNVDIDFSADL